MPIIGHALEYVLLHSSSFANTPYYKFDLRKDTLQQVVPAGMFHVQSALGALWSQKQILRMRQY
jgi:hypothetical protein